MKKNWLKNMYREFPKKRTIEEVHDLWLRSSERSQKQHEYFNNVLNEVISTIDKNSNNEYVVYYINDNIYYNYTISYNNDFKSYQYSKNRLKFNNNKSIGRDEKINFLLSNEKAFELGEKLKLADVYKSTKSFLVKHKLLEMIEDKLRHHFKMTDTRPNDITVVEISGKKYYLKVDSQFRYTYLKFSFVEMDAENVIVL